MIGSEQRIAGDIIRIVRRQVDREIEGLLAILGARREHLFALRNVAAVIFRSPDIAFIFASSGRAKNIAEASTPPANADCGMAEGSCSALVRARELGH